MPSEPDYFTKDFIEAGLKLSERDLLRERFLRPDESRLPAGPRVTAADNFLAELLADPDKAASSRPLFKEALGLAPESEPGAAGERPEIFPWLPDLSPGEAPSIRDAEISDDFAPLLDFQGRTAALLAGAALSGTAALSEELLYTRTLDGRPIQIQGTGGREPDQGALRLPAGADRVLVLAFVRTPEIMGMNPGLARLRPHPAGALRRQDGHDVQAIRPGTTSLAPSSAVGWLGWPEQAQAVLRLAERLGAAGWLALPSAGGLLRADLAGVRAGLGELGRQGLLITPEYGPNLRLFTILTDYPFTIGRPANFGVADYCETCRRCITECPAQALAEGPRRPDTNQWPVDRRACFEHWLRKGEPCRKCLEVCPYTREPLVGSPGGRPQP